MKTSMVFLWSISVVLSSVVYGVEGNFKFTVLDESGNPVVGAKLSMGALIPSSSKEAYKGYIISSKKGVSDQQGCWSMEGPTPEKPAVSARKEGYYDSVVRFNFNNWKKKPWSWDPYDQFVTLVLRKINNPIPMYAWGMYKLDYPVKTNEWVGLDMLQAEWMPPYGKGQTEDVQICIVRNRGKRDYEKTPLSVVSIRFMREFNGVTGIPETAVCEQSWFKLPYAAPRDGYAMKDFSVSHFVSLEGDVEHYSMSTGTTNCFFRIRSRLDKDGNFIDGLYGKIKGLVKIGNGGPNNISLSLDYYVNPTPNDLNMEWNPKLNLVPKKEAYKVLVFP